MSATVPFFAGQFSQSEATVAQRTFSFPAVDVTDGVTLEPGLTYAGADCLISKNGAAAGNLAGTVTEIGSTGVYQVVLAAADLDTLGTALIRFLDAAARTVWVAIQVIAADLNVAQAGAAELAAVQADVDTVQLQTVPMRVTGPHSLGTRTTDGNFTAISGAHCAKAVVNVSGTWNGATVTIQTCPDVTAGSPVWTAYDDGSGPNPLTANGEVTVTGPVNGIRAVLSDDGASTSLTATVTFHSPA